MAPPSGGVLTPSTPILQQFVEGDQLYGPVGYCPRSMQEYVAMERQTSKKPQKLDKFPPCPLNNPYSYLNAYVTLCRPGPLL